MSFVNREAARLSGEVITFSFGKNWQKYLAALNEERIASACRSIQWFTGLETLQGQTFFDAGCGSGLFSLAAYRLDADLVISMEIDPFAVGCVQQLWIKEGRPSNWAILRGSVLATPFREASLNFVYSWGVLHHTGAMWQAIEHVAKLVSPQGRLYIAVYNEGRFSAHWLRVKQFYNRQSEPVKHLMILGYAIFSIVMMLRNGQNPWRVIRDYGHTARGMSWLRDIEDWLGGLPYEYARPEAVESFLKKRGFECARQSGMEYLFLRRSQPSSAFRST